MENNNRISPKVTIQIVTWNSSQYLPVMLKSVFDQTFTDYQILLIDNASRDDTLSLIRSEFPTVHVLRNSANLGYSRAHNQGLRLQHSELVLIMNPDIVLAPNFLAETVKTMASSSDLAAVCGKLHRFHFSDSDLREVVDDGIIDATGLMVKRSFQVLNRDAGKKDRGQFAEANDTFGASGALALFRRSALDAVKIDGQVFDENMFAYKEDVDLAWRLQRSGWRTRYQPAAVALHFREAKDAVLAGHRAVARARKSKNNLVNFLSYRNHALVIIKNVPFKTIVRHLPRLVWYELQKLLYALVFEPKTLGAIGEIIKSLPTTLRQRRQVSQLSNKNTAEIEPWLQ